ncbi:hypothetical protein ACFFGH_33975 [Lysobacter korlensis]|uniref:Uncharacterized protein n=1 Tax=Lysobacter korlensis TaxID=553636 RepID=A0ABV6S418_9GAMM
MAMHNGATPAYEFRIDYGEIILPYGPDGDDEFAAGALRVYSDTMPIPERVVVRWRSAPGQDGQEFKYPVPLASLVTRQQRMSRFLTVRFTVKGDALEVRVGEDARQARLSPPVFTVPTAN